VVNGTNMLGKDNPRWGISNAIETIRVPGAHLCAPLGSIGTGYGVIVAWLIGVPRRAGRRLFEMKDQEARWHRWQATETLGGLGRRYRDPRFDALKVDESLRRHEVPDSAIRPDDTGCPLGGERLWRPGASSSECSPPSRACPL
jgi:hypothetical protein